MRVLHAVAGGDRAFLAHNLETDDRAVIVTTGYPNTHKETRPRCGKLTILGEPCRNPVADGGNGCLEAHRGWAS